ncbi:MAG: heme-binding protein [Thermomonas sp.]
MNRKRIFLSAFLLFSLFGSQAMAVEEPAFKSVLKEGDFEVRDYPSLVVAEVNVSGEQKDAANKGFRLLAGYIFGGNKRRQGIAMTSPVAQQPTSEKIAMTAPVTQTQTAGNWTVRFTMPRAYTLEALPEPNDPRVKLRRLPPQRFAVLRFSGLARQSDVDAKSEELVALARSHGLRATGNVSLAQYNPPWTLWFMRRNEVMIPVEAGS